MRRNGIVNERCPKCNGNLFILDDLEDTYLQCLQCSKIIYLTGPDDYQERLKKVLQKTAAGVT